MTQTAPTDNRPKTPEISELAGVFSSKTKVQSAVSELRSVGIARRHIGVFTRSAAVDAAKREALPSVEALLKDANGPLTAPTENQHFRTPQEAPKDANRVTSVVLTAFAVAGLAVAGLAASGADHTAMVVGGAIGAVVGAAGGAFTVKTLAKRYARQIKHPPKIQSEFSGYILWVSVTSKTKEIAATYILRKNGADAIGTAA